MLGGKHGEVPLVVWKEKVFWLLVNAAPLI